MTAVEEVYEAFNTMHIKGAERMCASTEMLINSYVTNGMNSSLSIIAAISMMGGIHAPLVRTSVLLDEILKSPNDIEKIVKQYSKTNRILGYGSSFIKGEPDPIHADAERVIAKHSPKIHYFLGELTDEVHRQISDKLYPNTAMYSAVICHILNIHPLLIPSMAISARMPAWNAILRKKTHELLSK